MTVQGEAETDAGLKETGKWGPFHQQARGGRRKWSRIPSHELARQMAADEAQMRRRYLGGKPAKGSRPTRGQAASGK